MNLEEFKELFAMEFEGKDLIIKSLTKLASYSSKEVGQMTSEEVLALMNLVNREIEELTKLLHKFQAQKEVQEKELVRKLTELKNQFGVGDEQALEKEVNELESRLQEDLKKLSDLKANLTNA